MDLTPPIRACDRTEGPSCRTEKQRDVLIDKGTGGAGLQQKLLGDRTKRKKRTMVVRGYA